MNDQTTVQRAAEVALQANTPFGFWAPPGVGKTSWLRAWHRAQGWPMQEILVATMEPADIVGMPKAAERGYVRLAPPWAQRLYEATDGGSKPGTMFFDEISCATPAQQSPILAIAQDRRVGDLQFGPEIRFCFAANPPSQAAGGWDLALPLANRLVHFRWEASAQVFVKALRAGFPMPPPFKPINAWREEIPIWRSHVASFLSRRGNLALQVPTDDGEQTSLAWPSFRSWDNLTRLLACATGTDLALTLACATVGEGPATEFLGWLKNVDLPDPREVIRDPSIVGKPGPDDDHRIYAIVSSVVTLMESTIRSPATQQDIDLWTSGWHALHTIAEHSADVVAVFTLDIGRCKPQAVQMPQTFTDFANRTAHRLGVF